MKLSRILPERSMRIAFWCILAVGAALRFAALGAVPAGLNQDEASAGYEAWSLLHYGIDRNGNAWPVLFVAWGSGQNVLYSYLSIPFVALFGLNVFSVRLTAAVCGTLSLPLLFGAARRLRSARCGLWCMAALAVNPWHVLLSRWALESNLLPFCLLLGVYCLSRLRENDRWLIAAAAAFALSLYAYGTAFLFLLFFLPAAAAEILRKKRARLGAFTAALAVFLLIAAPITLCQLRNALGRDTVTLLGLTLPRLNESRQSAVSVFGGGGPTAMGANLRSFFRLLWTQDDGLLWNCAGRFGLLYGKSGLLLSLIGLARVFADSIGRRARTGERTLLLWLLASVCASTFISVNVNRVNMAFLPFVWLQGAALEWLASLGRPMAAVLSAVLLLLGTLFARFCFTDYADKIAPCFYDGLCEAIDCAAADENDRVWVSFDVNMPYIYVLFEEKIPPQTYLDSVQYMNPGGAFEWVTGFDRYRFGRDVPDEDGIVCIVRADKLNGTEPEAQFGEWCVLREKTAGTP